MFKKLNELIKDARRESEGDDDDRGRGKPERLKGDLQGWSSRRIDGEHRLVYRLTDEQLQILQCRFHYAK